MKSLLILGAGGFGQMVKETAIQLGYEEIVFLDDAAFGKDVVGKCCDYMAKYGEYKSKRKIASTLTFLGGCFAATDI